MTHQSQHRGSLISTIALLFIKQTYTDKKSSFVIYDTDCMCGKFKHVNMDICYVFKHITVARHWRSSAGRLAFPWTSVENTRIPVHRINTCIAYILQPYVSNCFIQHRPMRTWKFIAATMDNYPYSIGIRALTAKPRNNRYSSLGFVSMGRPLTNSVLT